MCYTYHLSSSLIIQCYPWSFSAVLVHWKALELATHVGLVENMARRNLMVDDSFSHWIRYFVCAPKYYWTLLFPKFIPENVQWYSHLRQTPVVFISRSKFQQGKSKVWKKRRSWRRNGRPSVCGAWCDWAKPGHFREYHSDMWRY